MTKIIAEEDLDSFFYRLGDRRKNYTVIVEGKVFKNMKLTFVKDKNGERFIFKND